MNDTSTKVSSSDGPGGGAFHYDHFLGPLFFEPYAIEVAKRIDPSPVSIALELLPEQDGFLPYQGNSALSNEA